MLGIIQIHTPPSGCDMPNLKNENTNQKFFQGGKHPPKNGGTFTFTDGCEYTGDFKEEKFDGYGKLTFSKSDYHEGLEYKGEFKNNEFHGLGTLTFNDGDKYIGCFEEGRFNGLGEYTKENGESYKGGFQNNKMKGQGECAFQSEGYLKKYCGQFEDDRFNGLGTCKYYYEIEQGFWRNGQLNKPFNITETH